MKKIMSFVVILSMLFAPVAFPASPWTEQKGYARQIWGKLQFGLTNTLLGWTELFTEPYEAVKNKENVVEGIGKGLVYTVGDTLGGVVHLVTFWCPKTDIPLPEGGVHCPFSHKNDNMKKK